MTVTSGVVEELVTCTNDVITHLSGDHLHECRREQGLWGRERGTGVSAG